jgi:hypothetical protein
MDRDTDLFVQAFWAKCREIIRPEIDAVVGELSKVGHDAGVSTQEYSATPDKLPVAVGPSLTVALKPAGESDGVVHPALQFHGDVVNKTVEVRTSAGEVRSYDLNTLHAAEVRNEIDEWLGRLIS